MAKVDSLSHTHLVLNESTSTALQPLADQDPSREELHGRKHTHARRHTDRHTQRDRSDAVNTEAGSPGHPKNKSKII